MFHSKLVNTWMKVSILGLCFLLVSTSEGFAQKKASASKTNSLNSEQEIISLSKKKWQWMADKKADTLAALFHENAMFVHMGGSWGKEQEVNIIRSGGIHYKHAEIQDTSVKFIGNTAILLSKIRLLAVVGGNEVTNPFMVTEVYVKEGNKWSLGSLSFTRLMGD
ncbi:hypothetical protein AHMF7616_03667 [Adhaeribacter pallidiroseus]|uniref:DUF4440 domain-containing protein n=2 Tax=Adhaeribacter pallidiroseus TaxID=2072847 RepID=A0A369QJY5_9BACT|nr:hypothetical protein AHMF7616_03667 [Adhaeribacter pallidiroseus]